MCFTKDYDGMLLERRDDLSYRVTLRAFLSTRLCARAGSGQRHENRRQHDSPNS
jgi:hypothetical protein